MKNGIFALIFFSFFTLSAQSEDPPNFVVIFCDDLGYGDIGSFGHPIIQTPNIDRMAVEGQKWTQFYVADPVCTPRTMRYGQVRVVVGKKNTTNLVGNPRWSFLLGSRYILFS